MSFSAEEITACRRLVELALAEDLGAVSGEQAHDITTKVLIPRDQEGKATLVARAPGVVAGMPAVELVLQTARTPLVKLEPWVEDGARVNPGDRLAVLSGLMGSILTAERTALNFLQHLSGVATLTRRYVDAIDGLPCKIFDTRKTTPGWRRLEKYAVRCGGGHNHRMGLYDAVLIKDNHLAALPDLPAGLTQGIRSQTKLPIEIEVDDLHQFDRVLAWNPDIILLDNMTPEQLRRAAELRAQKAPAVLLEASGGITLDVVRAVAETGVDRISVGAITHSAPALDIALDYD
jgi:nicotinate-nucleotide pyrophosphorylase (carboxylating)